MDRKKIENKVNLIINDIFGIETDEITGDSDLSKDLCMDSLDCVDILMSVEKGFDILIPDEDAWKIKKVGDIYDIVEKLTQNRV